MRARLRRHSRHRDRRCSTAGDDVFQAGLRRCGAGAVAGPSILVAALPDLPAACAAMRARLRRLSRHRDRRCSTAGDDVFQAGLRRCGAGAVAGPSILVAALPDLPAACAAMRARLRRLSRHRDRRCSTAGDDVFQAGLRRCGAGAVAGPSILVSALPDLPAACAAMRARLRRLSRHRDRRCSTAGDHVLQAGLRRRGAGAVAGPSILVAALPDLPAACAAMRARLRRLSRHRDRRCSTAGDHVLQAGLRRRGAGAVAGPSILVAALPDLPAACAAMRARLPIRRYPSLNFVCKSARSAPPLDWITSSGPETRPQITASKHLSGQSHRHAHH